MKDMDLKMANNETKSRSQTEEYWSEHFLSKFGLEYIKHNVLNKRSYKKKDTILKDFDLQMPSKEACTSVQPSYPRGSSRTAISLTQEPAEKQLQLSESELNDEEAHQLEVKAIHKIAQVLHIEADEKNITDMCIQFRREILLLLRRVVRQCFLIGWDMKIKWQLDFALLLMPPWLRTVEMELMMLPQAVVTECGMLSAETTLTTKFKALLEEGGSVKFSRWDNFDANYFKKVAAYYNITMTEARDVWSAMCSKTRQRIIQEAQCQEGSREINFELTDLLLLHDLSFNIVTSESLLNPKQLQKLTALYQCVLKKDVENVLRNERPRLLEVWLQVLAMYPFSLGFSSLVYIQRQWYELKQLARSEVLAFHLQHSHTPPHPLLLSIVANFRHIVQEPLPKWSDFVTSKMVVKFKDISKTVSKKVLEESMDVLNNAREQAEKENNYLDVQNHICIVQPLNSNKYINENNKTELDNAESNKLTENNFINNKNIIDKESQSNNKSDLIKHNIDTNVVNQTINNNKFFVNVKSNVAIKKNLDNKNTLIKNNIIECNEIDLNAVLNNIDPTKAQKHLIFDSDSDSETLSVVSQMEYSNNIKTDKQTYFETELNSGISQNNKHSKVINWINENDGNSKLFKENFISKMDKNIENDPKLTKKITIPLIRCDEIPSWKKYYKNHTINIKHLKNKLCPLKNINKKINTSKILPRRQTRNSCNSILCNTNLSINLDGLTENFLRNDKNRRLFKLCKQLSVRLHRFTNEQRTMCRRRKKIQLTDIEEVRKINSTILTAEVAPVSISRCDSPSEADSFGIFSEEPTREITNYNVIDALELDELFKKLPVPPLTPINLDKSMEMATNTSSAVLCRNDSEQNKINKSNNKVDESYDELNDKILSIIMKSPVHNQSKLPVNVITIRDSSDSDDNVRFSAVIDMMNDKRKKRQNRERNTQKQSKKKRKRKSKKDNSECKETECTNALEEWGRQKNLTKKYFQLPNITSKSSNECAIQNTSTNSSNNNILIPTNSNPYTNKSQCMSGNQNTPTLPTDKPSPVIDLTEGPDNTQLDQNGDTTPIITNVYSLATHTDKQDEVKQLTKVITPILVPHSKLNMINTDLGSLTGVQVANVGSDIVHSIPQANTLVPMNVPGQQIYVQQSPLTQYTSETAGRSFVIIPKSQLMDGNTSLLLPNLKIVNASLTCNPVDHIQRMMVPNDTQVEIEPTPAPLLLMPLMPLDLWVQGKSVKELVILQIDASKPSWTLTGGHTVVTLTDYTCESPVYCSLPLSMKTRIIFPQENNGADIYNPLTLQIYENVANGTSPFAKWVKSVIDNTENDYIDNCANNCNVPETQTKDDKCEIDRPVSRIKVKSFARLTEMQDGNFIAPERVCLQDRLYMKVSEQPLKYAKVITALSSLEEFLNLMSGDVPLKLLSKDVTGFDSLQSININHKY